MGRTSGPPSEGKGKGKVVAGTEMESSEICLNGEVKRVQNGCSLSLALFSLAGHPSGHEAMGSLQNPMSSLRPPNVQELLVKHTPFLLEYLALHISLYLYNFLPS